MKKPTVILITTLFSLSPLILAQETAYITFSYTFLYRTSTSQIHTIDCTKESARLAPTDQLKIFIKPENNTYIYLFLHDAEGDLYLIYPGFFSYFDEQQHHEPGFYFPRGFEWLKFSEGPGEERFYILASSTRLYNLEKATDAYLHLFEQQIPGKEFENARKVVLEEIRRLQIEHFEYVKKAKTEIQLVAGEFRGFEEVFEFPVHKVTGCFLLCTDCQDCALRELLQLILLIETYCFLLHWMI